MTSRKPDISALTAILDDAEGEIEAAMLTLDVAVADIARLIGPLAAAHACARAAIEMAKQADAEAGAA